MEKEKAPISVGALGKIPSHINAITGVPPMQYRIPDYASLVSLLPRLKRLPDALGETTLTPEEAVKIQALGFVANEGRWQIPPVPPELVRDNPLLEHFSFRWDFPKNGAPATSSAW